MKRPILTLLSLVLGAAPCVTQAQSAPTVRLTVHVAVDGAPLANARVRAGSVAAVSNVTGTALLRVAPGRVQVVTTRLGYAPDTAEMTLAAGRDTTITVEMHDIVESLTSVVVTSARGATRIEDSPTRIEVLGGEDVAEKMEMRPADATGFLSEMSGVRIQRTSASTGAAGVRLQGLRPRYTLLLSDGLPLAASASGLDILQLPPADLRQVEVIKGPATALYGPAALGGMINLVSKRPAHERDLLVQQSSQRGTNAFGWYSEAFSPQWGLTTLVGAHTQQARDRDGDGWAEMPGFDRIELRPRLFYTGSNGSALLVTTGLMREDRRGGFLAGRLAPDGTSYDEDFGTTRMDVGAIGHTLVGEHTVLQFRGVASRQAQDARYGTESERTVRQVAFAELSAQRTLGTHELTLGTAIQQDHNDVRNSAPLTYDWTTMSAFAQDVWRIVPRVAVTGSARVDDHSRFGTLASPRLSMLYTLRDGLTARASIASGRSAPTPYVEETQAVGVRRLSGFRSIIPERARYASADVTGRTGPLEVNATVFDTRVTQPVETESAGALLLMANATAPVTARGAELFAVFKVANFFATALYGYTKATEPVFGTATTAPAPYMPKHTGGLDLTWESAESGTWIALEGFYSGAQVTRDDPAISRTPPYTVVGLLCAQQGGPVRVFMSLENLTDVRQTRAAPLLLQTRSPEGRWTTAPWGQLEGRVISLGVRWSHEGRTPGLAK